MAKTRQQVAAEIKQLLEENGYTLKTVTKYFGSCDDCYDEDDLFGFVYVSEKSDCLGDGYSPATFVTSI